MKKFISLFLTIVMLTSSLTMAANVFAAEPKTAKVNVSVQASGGYLVEPQELEVSASLSEEYAEQIGFDDKADEPTIVDAAIAIHIAAAGKDFAKTAPLTVSDNTWFSDFLGLGSGFAYYKNTASVYSFTEAVADGDVLEFAFYSDTAMYSDLYVCADSRVKNVVLGDEVELTFTASDWNGSYSADGLAVYVDGDLRAYTDENGYVSISLNEIGSHVITTSGDTNGGKPAFMSWCRVNVTSNTVLDYIDAQQKNASDYLKGGSYTLENTYDFLKLIRSGCNVKAYKNAYVKSVKDNLSANKGKILIDEKENLGLYGAVISTLKALGYNTKAFFGYNINEAFEGADIVEARAHQYHYEYAIAEASEDRAKAIIDDLIANYYTKGKGMDNYGYSCDNTAHFLIAIAPYASEYVEYISDAEDIIKAHTNEYGAYYSQTYNDANADSTALAMAAFASVGLVEEAYNYYKLLVENYESDKAGLFTYYGEVSTYAIFDGMYSLYYFRSAVYNSNFEHTEHINKKVAAIEATCTREGLSEGVSCPLCGEVIVPQSAVEKKAHTVVNDKAVAPTFTKAGKTAGKHCKVCNTVIVKQKAVAKLGAAKLSSVKGAGKSFIAKWKKVKGVDGYQVQYSLKKNFKGAKAVKVKKAATKKTTVKGLKAKKTYYVRIRAYKKINGKVKYSKWSAAKTVKTR